MTDPKEVKKWANDLDQMAEGGSIEEIHSALMGLNESSKLLSK